MFPFIRKDLAYYNAVVVVNAKDCLRDSQKLKKTAVWRTPPFFKKRGHLTEFFFQASKRGNGQLKQPAHTSQENGSFLNAPHSAQRFRGRFDSTLLVKLAKYLYQTILSVAFLVSHT
jgi:hypothetical protein